ncbi:MAG: hypothetical protein BM485_13960 [Desulfobulbaceae bacterium DB1]|nr:MAG: hypothetical protein BM485_13960 [Desulfobulbaceae bacterium DB1]
MDPEKIMNGIAKELESAFTAMAKTKKVEEKLQYSQIIKNLCESLGVFLELANDMMPYEYEEEDN